MRRTKEEAARTRDAIVEAALACFDRSGIAQATIDEIAAAAGVTKGAVYHHFSGKDALLREIRERVSLPLLDKANTALLRRDERPALERIERFLVGVLETLETCAHTRRALGVMQFKCEYVGGLHAELAGALRSHRHLLKAFEAAYLEAHAAGELATGLTPTVAAFETTAFLNGLVRLWLIDAAPGGLRENARAAIHGHMEVRRARTTAARGHRT